MLTMLRGSGSHQSIVASSPIKSMIHEGDFESYCLMATGRSLIYELLKSNLLGKITAVLMPAYVAEGVYQPVSKLGIKIVFYKLNADLTPDINSLKNQLKGTNGRLLFILINYFGFSCLGEGLYKLLKEKKIPILEDCAHALFKTPGLAGISNIKADLMLYSFNKFLPVTDGAILGSTSKDLDVSKLMAGMKRQFSEKAIKAYKSHLDWGGKLLIETDLEKSMPILRKLSTSYEDYYQHISQDFCGYNQSEEAKYFLQSIDIKVCREKRLSNANIIFNGLDNSLFKLIFKQFREGDIPWCVPALVPSKHRAEIIEHILSKNILLSTLIEKWNYIPSNSKEFHINELRFINEHILIPVNENISESEMNNMVMVLNNIRI
jgi:dTDP-4-amino-4,6-dideoxygalactose transaminase